jgi:hypothetical protein
MYRSIESKKESLNSMQLSGGWLTWNGKVESHIHNVNIDAPNYLFGLLGKAVT